MNNPPLTDEMAEAVRLAVMTTYSMTEDEQQAAALAVHRAVTDRAVRVEVLANVARQAIKDFRDEMAARARMVRIEIGPLAP